MDGHQRARWRPWVLGGVAVVIVALLGSSVWNSATYHTKYGTYRWWGPPHNIQWCGETYHEPDDVDLSPAKIRELRTIMIVPPLRRRLMIPRDAKPCHTALYLRMSDDHFIAYVRT